ncbi:hypothetical protein [Mesorhizobium sp. M0621]|uniref:hypothetical protein n=1 Tax=Mesorhizobium sp. M0621 TaxID=2956974 RepID=UPI0033398BCD
MAGNETHQQSLRVIEKRENTKNAGKDFDAKTELGKTDAERAASRQDKLRPKLRDIADPDDRNTSAERTRKVLTTSVGEVVGVGPMRRYPRSNCLPKE